MKALVGAFNQEKALVGAFSVIVQPVVEPMDRFTAIIITITASQQQSASQNTRLFLLTHGAGVQNTGDNVDPADHPRHHHLHTLQISGKVIVKQENKVYSCTGYGAWAIVMLSGWSSTYS